MCEVLDGPRTTPETETDPFITVNEYTPTNAIDCDTGTKSAVAAPSSVPEISCGESGKKFEPSSGTKVDNTDGWSGTDFCVLGAPGCPLGSSFSSSEESWKGRLGDHGLCGAMIDIVVA